MEPLNMTIMTESFDEINDSYGVDDNSTFNGQSDLEMGIRSLNHYGTPIIITFGLFNNTLAVLLFRTARLKELSVTTYLVVTAYVELIFFISHIITYISGFAYPLTSLEGVCQIVTYLSIVCFALPSMLLTAALCDQICFLRRCLTDNASTRLYFTRKVVLSVCVIGCCMNVFPLWSMAVRRLNGYMQCFPISVPLAFWLDQIGAGVSVLLPVIMLVLCLVTSIMSARAMRQYLRPRGKNDSEEILRNQIKIGLALQYSSVATALLLLPNNIVRLRTLVETPTFSLILLAEILRFVALLSFTIKLPVYLVRSRLMRREVKRLFSGFKDRARCFRKVPPTSRSVEMQPINREIERRHSQDSLRPVSSSA